MDDLEQRVAERLAEPFVAAEPPEELGPRIVHRAAAIRRRRAAITGAAVAVVLVVAPIATAQRGGGGPAVMPGSDRTLTVTATPGPAGLNEMIDRKSVVRIGRALPGAEPFVAIALGADGTVLGAAERGSGEDQGAATGVWRAGPKGGTPKRIVTMPAAKGAYLWRMAVGERGYLWPDQEQLACLGPGGQGPARVFAEGWGGRDPFYADGGAFVWSNEGQSLMVASGCGAPAKSFSVPGALQAFSYPDAFVQSRDSLHQVDVRTGSVKTLPEVPAEASFAANDQTLAWTDGRTLTLLDRRSGQVRDVLRGQIHGLDESHTPQLTLGDRLVVFSAVSQDDASQSTSIVYDMPTGQKVELPGQAWVAGNRLLWQEGDRYLVAKTRA